MRKRQNPNQRFIYIAAVLGILLLAAIAVLPLAHVAAVSDIRPAGLPRLDADQQNIKNILQIVFGIIGAFAVLNITFSGLKYITSAGNEQKTAEAKNGIVYSLVGLMIAITAEAIVAFVVNGVGK